MKTFFVKTQTCINDCRLHSIDKAEFATTSLQEAEEMFDKEVAALANAYQTYEQVCENYPAVEYYGLNENEQNNAIYCSILAIDDEDPDEVEFIKDSEYFYDL